MTRDQLEDLEQAELAAQDKIQCEARYNDLYSAVHVRPVNFCFGWIQLDNPSTITFEEAMEAITAYVETLKSGNK